MSGRRGTEGAARKQKERGKEGGGLTALSVAIMDCVGGEGDGGDCESDEGLLGGGMGGAGGGRGVISGGDVV